MKFIHILYLLSLSLLLTTRTFAQDVKELNISGKVIDGATNDIIIGATVVTEKGNIGRDGRVVNAFFAKVNKHLHSKYNNIKGKHYRFPIPTGEKGEDLGIIPQNPGY